MAAGAVDVVPAVEELLARFRRPRDLRLEVPERTLADGSLRTPVDLDAVRAAAQALLDRGCLALWGIPLAHKDIYARPGRQPGCGVTRELPDSGLPPSPLLHRLEAAGSVELGVLNLAEFALGTTGSNALAGDARNPWDPARCTGGSSSGSAAAVAAGLAFASLGTDSGASVRLPAALCGVVGYMPAHGALDSCGCFPLSWSVDRPGVLARTVEDCALVCDIARGRAPTAPELPGGPLRVGLPKSYYTDHLAPAVAAAYDQAIRYCESLSHDIIEVPVVEVEEMRALHRAIMRTEAAAVHRRMIAEHPEYYDLPVRKFITGGEGIFALDYVDALRLRAPMQRAAIATTYDTCDLILTPTAPVLALRYDEIADAARPDIWQQVTGFVESLLRLVGLDWTAPDFSTLSRRQKTLAVNIPYRGSKGPLHLLIDSTGIKVEGEGEWHARKHGGPRRRIWREIHLGIDEETLEVRAIEITGSHVGDAPVLPGLPSQIPADQEIVTAGAMIRNEALRASKYLGRALWRPLSAASCGCACRAVDGADIIAGAASRRKCIA